MRPLRQISTSLLAVLLFLTSLGVSLHSHHCSMAEKTYTSLSKVKNCCHPSEKKECPKGCCHDETIHFQIDVESPLPANQLHVTIDVLPQLAEFIPAMLRPRSIEITPVKFRNYKPPLLMRNIPVLLQSFLL